MPKSVEVHKEVQRMCMGCALVKSGFRCETVSPAEQLTRATVEKVCYAAKTFTPRRDALTHSCRVRSILGRWGWKTTYNVRVK